MQRPVIILGMARSGTSLVSSIFRAHGFWSGITRSDRPSNYPTGQHENLAVKRMLINRYGRADERMISVPYDENWERIARKILKREGYSGGPWFVKHSALYGKLWIDFNPHWVCIRRDADAIVDSIRRKSRIYDRKDNNFLLDLIANHNNVMDSILEEYGGTNIQSEKLISGDYIELMAAFQDVGCMLDHEKVKSIIQPDIWGVTV